MVCTDARKEGVGGILMQQGRVVAYVSRKLKEYKKKYSAYDLELTVVTYDLKMWKHDLLGKKFLLMTDRHNFINLFKG